jgi:hypothetical protein
MITEDPNWRHVKTTNDFQIWTADYWCPDGDAIELYIGEDHFELACFSGIHSSTIRISDLDYPYFQDKVTDLDFREPFEKQSIKIADYFCKLFCTLETKTSMTENNNTKGIAQLLGKTITEINNGVDRLKIITSDGSQYLMHHIQDCCESVLIDDIEGDLNDLLNSPITQAEEVTNSTDRFGRNLYDSFTWTFYKLATVKGYVTIKWLGESNGYYSEGVNFDKIN